MMDRYFKVAEHIFELSMPEADSLWEAIGNYEPFRTEPTEDPLFRLELRRVDSMAFPAKDPIYDEHPKRDDMPRAKVFRGEDGWAFTMSPGEGQPYSFLTRASADFRSATLSIERQGMYAKFALDNSLMLLYSLCTAPLGTLAMHSSVIMHDGRGYMFLGVSGTGKSTHSRLWLENIPGCELMNDDNPVVRIHDDGSAWVYGTPWSGKTPCYKDIAAPIGAVVQIKQAPYNSLRRQEVLEAYTSLLTSCSGMRFHAPTEDAMSKTQNSFLKGTTFYLMECLPDADAARVCHEGTTQTNK